MMSSMTCFVRFCKLFQHPAVASQHGPQVWAEIPHTSTGKIDKKVIRGKLDAPLPGHDPQIDPNIININQLTSTNIQIDGSGQIISNS